MARGDLSRERVLEAARQAVDEDGIGALSMRRLAQRLDVWPMSIYTYFRDKDELLEALAHETASSVPLLGRPGRWWRAELLALLGEVRDAVARDPRERLPRALLAHTQDAGHALLARAGVQQGDAPAVWRLLVSYAVGDALTAGAADDEEFARGVDRILS